MKYGSQQTAEFNSELRYITQHTITTTQAQLVLRSFYLSHLMRWHS